MLAIQKRFPIGKGVTVGSLALVAGFLSSVAVLNMITGTEPATPVANVRDSGGQGTVLGSETEKENATTQGSSKENESSNSSSAAQSMTPLTWENSAHSTTPSGTTQPVSPMPVAPTQDEVTVPAPIEVVDPVDPPDDPTLPLLDQVIDPIQQTVPSVDAELNVGL